MLLFINTTQFLLEKVVRPLAVPGLVGAGGIGQALKAAFDLFHYRNAAPLTLVIFLIVSGMDWLADRLRRSAKSPP